MAIDLITEHIKMKLQQPELRRLYHNLELVPSNYQIRGMHTLIRDRTTSKADFVFYADRLLRLVRPAPVAASWRITPTQGPLLGSCQVSMHAVTAPAGSMGTGEQPLGDACSPLSPACVC